MLPVVASEDDGVGLKETCEDVGNPSVIDGSCGDGGLDGRHHWMVLLVGSGAAPFSAVSLLIRVSEFVDFWF